MPTITTTGFKPCATTEASIKNTSGCGLCKASADGYDAAYGGALCAECADAFGDLQSDRLEVGDE